MQPRAMMLEYLISTSLPSAAQKLLAVWINFFKNFFFTIFFTQFFKTKVESSTLRTVVAKVLYSPTRFV